MDDTPSDVEMERYKKEFKCNCQCKALGYTFDADIKKGYTQCCTVTEISKWVKYLPDLVKNANPSQMLPYTGKADVSGITNEMEKLKV